MDKMSDDSSELIQLSGETRITVSVQQISSRFQSMQVAAKEILKKCQQAVTGHHEYVDRYNESSTWLSVMQNKFAGTCSDADDGDLAVIEKKMSVLKEILSEQQHGISCYNRVIEMGEKLYATTAVEGRETVRIQMQELQSAIESFYDSVSSRERELEAKRARLV